MLADFFEFEGLLIALKLKGLMDTGEYIVVGVDTKVYDVSDPQKYVVGKNTIHSIYFRSEYSKTANTRKIDRYSH